MLSTIKYRVSLGGAGWLVILAVFCMAGALAAPFLLGEEVSPYEALRLLREREVRALERQASALERIAKNNELNLAWRDCGGEK